MKLLCSQRNRRSTSPTPQNEAADVSQGVDENIDVLEIQETESLGLYQVMLYLLISIPLCLTAGFTLSYVFTAGDVNYRCLVPECEEGSNTTLNPPWVHYSAPFKNGRLATCTRYVIMSNSSGTCSERSFSNETQSCDAWIFDPDENTILKQWQITCEGNQWKLTLVGTANSIGQFFGLVFSGYVSDKFGRRAFLTIATFVSGIAGLIHSFSVNYWMFLVFEIFSATFAAGIYSAGFVLGMELFGSRRGALTSTVFSCMFAGGSILLGLFAMWLKSWQAITLVIYVPALFTILLPLVIPESIRWLLAQGKVDEAEKVYRQMARMKRMQISEEAIRMFIERNTEKSRKTNNEVVETSVRQVMKSPVILLRVSTCSFCWLANAFIYYGLSLNSVTFTDDKYWTFILVVAIEIPAYFFAWFSSDYLGRKRTLCSSLLLSGIFCLLIQFVPPNVWMHLPLLLYLCGKCSITVAFTVIYTCAAEMFPTTLRQSLLGFCSMIGRIGAMLAPQTPLLANIMDSLPLILFGSMGIIAGLLSLNFPETLGTKLPDTIYEAECIGKAVLKKDSKNVSP